MCIYNVDRLNQQSTMFEKAGVVTLCIFKSTPQNIAKLSSASKSGDSVTLSDKKGAVFESFMVPKSTWAMLNGVVDMIKNFGKYKGKMDVPAIMKDSGGNVNQMRQLPADFMIDEDGVIVDLYRAEKMSDQMSFDRVEAFIPEDVRCKCKKKDCIVPRCREAYQEIRREAEQMLFTG